MNMWNNIILRAFSFSHVSILVLVEETLNRTNGYPKCYLICSSVTPVTEIQHTFPAGRCPPSTVRCLINSLKPVPLLNILKTLWDDVQLLQLFYLQFLMHFINTYKKHEIMYQWLIFHICTIICESTGLCWCPKRIYSVII